MSISKENSAVAQNILPINATEQLAEISLGLRKTFDITGVISAMATAALDTGLNAKLPQFTDDVAKEVEKVTEDFAEGLVGDAIMGTPLNLETWIDDERAPEIKVGWVELAKPNE